jgi:hypothetical protein
MFRPMLREISMKRLELILPWTGRLMDVPLCSGARHCKGNRLNQYINMNFQTIALINYMLNNFFCKIIKYLEF